MYYNQNDYPKTAYPAPGYENATVKSGGCGVVCASIIVEELTDHSFPPTKSAPYSIEKGARVSGGTDMKRLGQAVAQDFGISFETTNDLNKLKSHIKQGGIAACNAGGDRSGYKGVFSSGGHYVVAMKYREEGPLLWDPGLYSGKYQKSYRSAVTVSGNDLYAPWKVLEKDCENRSPRYYLFAKEEEKVPDKENDAAMQTEPSAWAKEAWDKAVQEGVLDGTGPRQPVTREQLALVLQRLGLLK